ncbi:MAG: hypothetical protein M1133_05645 [Armatimonadetes bacterium]|nr:hypothetical protein [Armatimonadota bacterium]
MTRVEVILLVSVVLLGVTVLAAGCGTGKPGLLEQNGIKAANDLTFAMIEMAEGGGNYLINDRPTLDRVYQLLNDTVPATKNMYIRPDMVTLVRNNGRTVSFAFSLYNSDLTTKDGSPSFVKFVKTEIVGHSKYLDRTRLPTFTIRQAAKIEGSTKRKVLPPAKAQQVQQAIGFLSSAYKPFGWTTKTSDWNTIVSYCTAGSPGFEAVMSKPVHFQTLVGWTGPEPPNGSDALNLVNLTVDRMLVYRSANSDLLLAFHSGNSWFVTGPFNPKDLHGRTPEGIYSELLSS